LELDNHGLGVTEKSPDGGNGYEAGKPIEVVEQLEFCHCHSMTSFSTKGKTIFSENCRVLVVSQAESYPLKNAKSQFSLMDTSHIDVMRSTGNCNCVLAFNSE
jgi:hypothetical protein